MGARDLPAGFQPERIVRCAEDVSLFAAFEILKV
jgi:hypothetical protein